MTILHWLVVGLLGFYGWRLDHPVARAGIAVFVLVLGTTGAAGAAVVPFLAGLGGMVLLYQATADLHRLAGALHGRGAQHVGHATVAFWIGYPAVVAAVGGWAVVEASLYLP